MVSSIHLHLITWICNYPFWIILFHRTFLGLISLVCVKMLWVSKQPLSASAYRMLDSDKDGLEVLVCGRHGEFARGICRYWRTQYEAGPFPSSPKGCQYNSRWGPSLQSHSVPLNIHSKFSANSYDFMVPVISLWIICYQLLSLLESPQQCDESETSFYAKGHTGIIQPLSKTVS